MQAGIAVSVVLVGLAFVAGYGASDPAATGRVPPVSGPSAVTVPTISTKPPARYSVDVNDLEFAKLFPIVAHPYDGGDFGGSDYPQPADLIVAYRGVGSTGLVVSGTIPFSGTAYDITSRGQRSRQIRKGRGAVTVREVGDLGEDFDMAVATLSSTFAPSGTVNLPKKLGHNLSLIGIEVGLHDVYPTIFQRDGRLLDFSNGSFTLTVTIQTWDPEVHAMALRGTTRDGEELTANVIGNGSNAMVIQLPSGDHQLCATRSVRREVLLKACGFSSGTTKFTESDVIRFLRAARIRAMAGA